MERVLFNESKKRLLACEISAFTAFGYKAWERCYQRWSGRLRLASQPSQFQCFMSGMKRLLILQLFGALVVAMAHATTNFDLAAKATNELAVDLHRQLATGNENLCVSPFSIESALAMTFAGADGDTRTEMARVLHFPSDASAVAASFASLQHSLEEMTVKTAELVKKSKEFGGPSEPITLNIANRLFAQKDYDFRQPFLSLVKQNYGAAFEPLDFIANPAAAAQHINKWVADQTRDRIRDLIPARRTEQIDPAGAGERTLSQSAVVG